MFNNIEGIDIVIAALLLITFALLATVILLLNELRHYKKTTVIQLGLKDNSLTTGVEAKKLHVNPADFVINKDKLRERLLDAFKKKEHPDISTLAYCILAHAGLYELLDSDSAASLKKALTRLLNNGNERATISFLNTIADSVV